MFGSSERTARATPAVQAGPRSGSNGPGDRFNARNAAYKEIAPKLGCSPDGLCIRYQQAERDAGQQARATEIGVKRLELGIQARQRVVDHLTYRAQRMPRRDALLQVNIAEQRPARLVRPAHLHPRRCPA